MSGVAKHPPRPSMPSASYTPAGDAIVPGREPAGLSQRKHASRVASITQVGARDVPQGVLPQQRTAIGPEITDLGLLRGTRSAGQGTLGSLQGINGWRCPDCLATAR